MYEQGDPRYLIVNDGGILYLIVNDEFNYTTVVWGGPEASG